MRHIETQNKRPLINLISKMDREDYQYITLEIVSMIKDKAAYLKSTAEDSNFNLDQFEGMKMAYHHVLDGIKTYLECHEDASLEEFGMQDFDPCEILDYKPIRPPV